MTKKAGVSVGDKFVSNTGEEYEVVDYSGSNRGVTIRFLSTGNTMLCSTKEVKNGAVKNPLQKSVYGVGCFGIGPYKAKVNGKFTPEYQLWIGMMTRVYDPKALEKHPTYKNASVCEEWLNFQNFAEWCQDQFGFNVAEPNGRRHNLDKDLLVPNNTEYSPTTCCFLPSIINVSLKGRQCNKKTELPSGVYWHNASQSYTSCLDKEGVQYHLGCFQSITAARDVYRQEKTAYRIWQKRINT